MADEFTLPSLHWPSNGLEEVSNLPEGYQPEIYDHFKASVDIHDELGRCFEKLPKKRVLIIVLAKTVSQEIIDAVRKVRGQTPLVVDKTTEPMQNNSPSAQRWDLLVFR